MPVIRIPGVANPQAVEPAQIRQGGQGLVGNALIRGGQEIARSLEPQRRQEQQEEEDFERDQRTAEAYRRQDLRDEEIQQRQDSREEERKREQEEARREQMRSTAALRLFEAESNSMRTEWQDFFQSLDTTKARRDDVIDGFLQSYGEEIDAWVSDENRPEGARERLAIEKEALLAGERVWMEQAYHNRAEQVSNQAAIEKLESAISPSVEVGDILGLVSLSEQVFEDTTVSESDRQRLSSEAITRTIQRAFATGGVPAKNIAQQLITMDQEDLGRLGPNAAAFQQSARAYEAGQFDLQVELVPVVQPDELKERGNDVYLDRIKQLNDLRDTIKGEADYWVRVFGGNEQLEARNNQLVQAIVDTQIQYDDALIGEQYKNGELRSPGNSRAVERGNKALMSDAQIMEALSRPVPEGYEEQGKYVSEQVDLITKYSRRLGAIPEVMGSTIGRMWAAGSTSEAVAAAKIVRSIRSRTSMLFNPDMANFQDEITKSQLSEENQLAMMAVANLVDYGIDPATALTAVRNPDAMTAMPADKAQEIMSGDARSGILNQREWLIGNANTFFNNVEVGGAALADFNDLTLVNLRSPFSLGDIQASRQLALSQMMRRYAEEDNVLVRDHPRARGEWAVNIVTNDLRDAGFDEQTIRRVKWRGWREGGDTLYVAMIPDERQVGGMRILQDPDSPPNTNIPLILRVDEEEANRIAGDIFDVKREMNEILKAADSLPWPKWKEEPNQLLEGFWPARRNANKFDYRVVADGWYPTSGRDILNTLSKVHQGGGVAPRQNVRHLNEAIRQMRSGVVDLIRAQDEASKAYGYDSSLEPKLQEIIRRIDKLPEGVKVD